MITIHQNKVYVFKASKGRLRGLGLACLITDYSHPCSNPGVGISEGCFIFDFASLHLEVARLFSLSSAQK